MAAVCAAAPLALANQLPLQRLCNDMTRLGPYPLLESGTDTTITLHLCLRVIITPPSQVVLPLPSLPSPALFSLPFSHLFLPFSPSFPSMP